MFSKALYKQSWKANWIAWFAIAVVMSFILVIIMGMAGGAGVGGAASSFTDTVIKASVEANFQKRALNYYYVTSESFAELDNSVVERFIPVAQTTPAEEIPLKLEGIIKLSTLEMLDGVSQKNEELYGELKDNEATATQFSQLSQQTMAALTFSLNSQQKAIIDGVGDLYTLYEDGAIPENYDFNFLFTENPATLSDYINSPERINYRQNRALNAVGVFVGGTM